MDIMTRYFLRRLAIARRKPHVDISVPHSDALAEVMIVALTMPMCAILSFVVVITMSTWKPIVDARWPWLSFRLVVLGCGFLVYIVGQWWLRRRFKQYRDDPSHCLDFDTEQDRRIVFWQKFVVVIVCGAVVPFLGIAIREFLMR